MDERDQHLVTSVNALSCKEWNESYGKIYKERSKRYNDCNGAHIIALPAYEEYFDPETVRADSSGNFIGKSVKRNY